MEESQHPEQGPRSTREILLIVIFVAIAVGLYFVAAKKLEIWPYNKVAVQEQGMYQSTGAGFKIEYPTSWHHEECTDTGPDGIYVLAAFGDATDLVVCNSDAPFQGYFAISSTPGTITDEEVQGALAAMADGKKTDITIDGLPGTRIDGLAKPVDGHTAPAGTRQAFIWVEKSGRLYRFLFTSNEENLDKFEAALKTFTFL